MNLRIFKSILFWIPGVILMVCFIAFVPSLRRHWVTYPKLVNEIESFKKLRKEPAKISLLNTYRGVMHAHSYWSHDSEGTLFDLIPAAKSGGIDFIFLTDHPHGNLDTIPRGYKGYFDGVLIEPGSEKQGFDTWPLDSMIIDWKVDKDTVAKTIRDGGGLVFYAHTEQPHNWSSSYYHGMEIYNFHTDTKDEKLMPQILNFLVNGNKYRQLALREMFDEQTKILALWDSLNAGRKIVGFSAVDAHENQNIRARYLKDGRVEWVGPNANVIDTMKLAFWNKWLFSAPDANGWIFKWMVDTYKEGFQYITNYVFADSLTVPSLANHIKKGHLFTAFKSLGDAKGFNYHAQDGNGSVIGILGDSVRIDQVKTLHAVSPLPGRFRLIHDGHIIHVSQSPDYNFSWAESLKKGAYRLEIYIRLNGEDVPWLYTNPIYVY